MMTNKEKRIAELEEMNGELYKEILLDEVAIFETEKLSAELDPDISDHPFLETRIQMMKDLVLSLENGIRNKKVDIFKNNFEINRLLGQDGN